MQIAIIGLGNMGTIYRNALIRQAGQAGQGGQAEQLIKANHPVDIIEVTKSAPSKTYINSDIIIIAVKPKDVKVVLANLKSGGFNPSQTTLWTLAAGLSSELYTKILGDQLRLVRHMPNTPLKLGKGVISLSKCGGATDADLETAKNFLTNFGTSDNTVITVSEEDIHKVTAISGSGPAYFYQFAIALRNAGMTLGLSEADARNLAIKTATGAGLMLENADQNGVLLEDLISEVASKGGTTEAALASFMDDGIQGMVNNAVFTCFNRSRNLG